LTALATLAFINYGFTESDSAVSKAINYILSNVKSDGSIWSHYPVYDTSMSVITLLANRDIANKYHSIIENAKNFLISAQNVEPDFPFTDRFYGGWPYSKGQYWADLSNTQFALLALYEARRAGFTVPDDVFNKAATFVTRCQNLKATNPSFSFYDDGGFIYQPGSTIWANGMSYASMTAAGVWSLHCCGISSTDVRVKAGLKWLATNYYVDRNYPIGNTWLYYYLFSAAKAYFLTGTITIDGHDWYADISEYLKNRQAADGRWISIFHEEPDELATVEAILALETKAPPRISRLVTFKVDSPADLHIYDPLNRHVGINYVTGEIEIEVPNSTYSGPGTEPQIITVADPVAGTYRVELVGKATGPYTLRIEGVVDSTLVYTESYSGAINIGEVHASEVTISAIVGPLTIWATSPTFVKVIDNIPPTTTLTLGNPKYVENGNTYVNSATLFTLIATDNPGGTGVSETAYRIYNSSYNTGWLNYTSPFCLIGLSDGTYNIDYNSTDNVGNVETTNTATVILDNTGPLVTIVNPPIGWALQDGVTFLASAVDSGCGVSSLNFSIRESNGAGGIPVGFEDIPATYNATTDKWTLFFDTLLLPDGYYVVLARAKDNLGNVGPSSIVPYSIRNWAIIELLPASESNKAGRTMPVKFALRVAASVDPLQPFVYNEELVIRIYATCNPNVILQESRFGDTAKDYRINTIEEHYITNFKTLKTPMEYTVTVYRDNFEIGGFTFKTVK
jgi:squalene-hopene/tetraprenyl-beta-curcumene cyclase